MSARSSQMAMFDVSGNLLSEKVQGMASSVYKEFECVISKHGGEAVKGLMPLVVSILENLDQNLKERRQYEVDLELSKVELEHLKKQFEKEKTLRKSTDSKFLETEDMLEESKKQFNQLKNASELLTKRLELKVKNLQEHVGRLEEKEHHSKEESARLQHKYSDLLRNHTEYMHKSSKFLQAQEHHNSKRIFHDNADSLSSTPRQNSFKNHHFRPGSFKIGGSNLSLNSLSDIRERSHHSLSSTHFYSLHHNDDSNNTSPSPPSSTTDHSNSLDQQCLQPPTDQTNSHSSDTNLTPTNLNLLTNHSTPSNNHTNNLSVPQKNTDSTHHHPPPTDLFPPFSDNHHDTTAAMVEKSDVAESFSTTTRTDSNNNIESTDAIKTTPDSSSNIDSLNTTTSDSDNNIDAINTTTTLSNNIDVINTTTTHSNNTSQEDLTSKNSNDDLLFGECMLASNGAFLQQHKYFDGVGDLMGIEEDMGGGGSGGGVEEEGARREGVHPNVSLYEEFSILDEDNDILSVGAEVDKLIQENTELLATKNALNVLKDDLISQVEELSSELELCRVEVASLQCERSKQDEKRLELEGEVHALKEQGASTQAKLEEKERSDKDSFSRVELVRVLMERNQYKEKLMELQEAVRWAETVRANRSSPRVTSPPSRRKQNTSGGGVVWNMFNSFLGLDKQDQ